MRGKIVVLTVILMSTMASLHVNAQNNLTPKIGTYIHVDYSAEDMYTYIFEENNKITHYKNVTELKAGTYRIDVSSGVSFINIQWNNNTTERFLMLIDNDFLCFYNGDNFPVFFGLYYNVGSWSIRTEAENKLERLELREFENVTASNSLIENGIDYSPTPGRLGLHINRAWAVRGGIGENLIGGAYFDSYYDGHVDDQHLYISSGYVSYSKPNLYYENSRPKKIRIYDLNNISNFQDFVLLDTPNFQIVDVSNLIGNPISYIRVKLKIEILELYPGTKYNDTCINSIIFFFGNYK